MNARAPRLTAALTALVLTVGVGASTAQAQDHFGADCDGVFFVPSQGVFSWLVYEDLFPRRGDYDFNDGIVAINVVGFLQNGEVVGLQYTIEVFAIGATLHSGLALNLPGVPRGAGVATLYLEGDPDQPTALLPWPEEDDFVVTIYEDHRAVFPNEMGFVNTPEGDPYIEPAFTTVLRIDFPAGIPTSVLDPGDALYDLFFFRSHDRKFQVHMPEYAGTNLMDTSVFNTGDDASTALRHFITYENVPWLLLLPDPPIVESAEQLYWATERTSIDWLLTRLAAWAANGGGPNEFSDFLINGVQLEYSFQEAGRNFPIPASVSEVPLAFQVSDDACTEPPATLPTQILYPMTFPDPPIATIDDGGIVYILFNGYVQCIDTRNPTAPVLLGVWEIGDDTCRDLAKNGDHLYAACDNVHIGDVSDPLAPIGAGSIATGPASSVASSGSTLYVGTAGGVDTYDVSGGSPTSTGSIGGSGIGSVRTSGGVAYYIDGSGQVGGGASFSCGPGGAPSGFAVWGDIVACSYTDSGIYLYDLSDPSNPAPVGSFGGPGVVDVSLRDGAIAYIYGDGQFVTANLADPSRPQILSDSRPAPSGRIVYIYQNGTAFCGHEDAGAWVGLPPYVIGTSPLDGTDAMCAEDTVRIWFSNLIDPTSIAGAIQIIGPSGPVAYTYEVTLNLVTLSFDPAGLIPGAHEIRVNGDIRSAGPSYVPGAVDGYVGSFTVDNICLRWLSPVQQVDAGTVVDLDFVAVGTNASDGQVSLTALGGFGFGTETVIATGTPQFSATWTPPLVGERTIFSATAHAEIDGQAAIGPYNLVVVNPVIDCANPPPLCSGPGCPLDGDGDGILDECDDYPRDANNTSGFGQCPCGRFGPGCEDRGVEAPDDGIIVEQISGCLPAGATDVGFHDEGQVYVSAQAAPIDNNRIYRFSLYNSDVIYWGGLHLHTPDIGRHYRIQQGAGGIWGDKLYLIDWANGIPSAGARFNPDFTGQQDVFRVTVASSTPAPYTPTSSFAFSEGGPFGDYVYFAAGFGSVHLFRVNDSLASPAEDLGNLGGVPGAPVEDDPDTDAGDDMRAVIFAPDGTNWAPGLYFATSSRINGFQGAPGAIHYLPPPTGGAAPSMDDAVAFIDEDDPEPLDFAIDALFDQVGTWNHNLLYKQVDGLIYEVTPTGERTLILETPDSFTGFEQLPNGDFIIIGAQAAFRVSPAADRYTP